LFRLESGNEAAEAHIEFSTQYYYICSRMPVRYSTRVHEHMLTKKTIHHGWPYYD